MYKFLKVNKNQLKQTSLMFQLDSSTTAFLVERGIATRILTLNWTTMNFTLRSETLLLSRDNGNCAPIRRFKNGPFEVAAAGCC